MAEGNNFVMKEGPEEDKEGKCVCRGLPGVDFSTFVLSLYSSALVQLGEMADPVTGIRTQNMETAQQTIDIICMLEKKTVGNLDLEEEKLMKSLLHELRMAFVKAKS